MRSIEIYPDFAQQATRNLLAVAANNVVVDPGDAMQLGDTNRYDAIAVSSSLPVVDERFEMALKPGGRLFIVVGQAPVMEALLVTRTGANEWQRVSLFETSIPALVNARYPSRFVF